MMHRSLVLVLLILLAAALPAHARDVMDGALRRAARGAQVPGILPGAGGQDIAIFVTGTASDADLAAAGFQAITRAGGVVTARGQAADAVRLAGVPGVERLALAKAVEPFLDAAVADAGVASLRVRSGDVFTGATGAGVIVGIVDSGVDPTHADFKKPDGTTRILRYWDQGSSVGTPPEIVPGQPLYGTEWMASHINNGSIQSTDLVGHGTHVAGIAAGDGSAGNDPARRYTFSGVAPNADLVVVQAQFLDTAIVDAVNYVFSVATKLGRPAVVNLSLGTQVGPHDGTSAVDRAMTALVGPGRLISVSVSNDGDKGIHAELHVPPLGRDSVGVIVDYQGQQPDPEVNFFAVNGFYLRPDSMAVTVVSPAGKRYGPYALGAEQTETATGEGTLYLLHWDGDPSTPNLELQMDVSSFDPAPKPNAPAGDPPAEGIWRLVFQDLAGSPGGGEVDLWMPASNPFRARFTADREDPTETVASPATAPGAIAVGAYNTKRCWLKVPAPGTHCTTIPSPSGDPQNLTFFSARGPTRDGRQKPDVVAPGFVIVSSLSSTVSPQYQALLNLTVTRDPDQAHYANVGTSMAAGFVTGALALLLEQQPNITPADVERRLRASSRQDAFTGAVWNDRFGHGKLHVPFLLDTTKVAVNLHRLAIQEVQEGYRIGWASEAGDGVTGFRALLAEPGTPPRDAGNFPGAGPHVLDVIPEPEGTVVRLEARHRDGAWRLWAETDPLFPRTRLPFLAAPYPNPFAAAGTRVLLRSPNARETTAEIVVVDLRGRRVRTWPELTLGSSGTLEVFWDGRTDRGEPAPAGVYWLRARTGSHSASVRLVRLP